jgi:hypothetical protein
VAADIVLKTAQHGRPGASGQQATPPSPAKPMPPDPQRLVLAPADLGPEYGPVLTGPAALPPSSTGASGWDAVYRSARTGTLVESLAVVYPSDAEAAGAAGTMEAIPQPGTARVVRAAGRVLVVVVVVGRGSDDAASMANRAGQVAFARATSGSG